MIATSNELDKIAPALAAAEAAISGAVKDATNPQFRNKYADLAAVIAAVKQPLADNHIAIIQAPGQIIEGHVQLTTRLLHSSGQWIQTTAEAPLGPKATAQAYGSAVTYLRRYSLAGLLSVPQVDDDANAATAASSAPVAAPEPAGATLTPEQAKALGDRLNAARVDMAKFLRYFEVNSLGEFPQSKLGEAEAILDKRSAK